ncbi:MAG: hypothetical protein RIQ64_1152 [Actinomycetota bacterium]
MGSLWNAYGCHSDRPSLRQRSSPRHASTLCDVCAGGALRFDTSPDPSGVGSTRSSPHLDDCDPDRWFINLAQFARVDQCRRTTLMARTGQMQACRQERRRLDEWAVFGAHHDSPRSHAQFRALPHVAHRVPDDRSCSTRVSERYAGARAGHVVPERDSRQELRPMGCSDRKLRPREGRLSTEQHPARSGEGRLRAGNQGHPRSRDPLLRSSGRRRHDGLRPRAVVRRHRTGGARVGFGSRALRAGPLGDRTRHQQLRRAHHAQRVHRGQAMGRIGRRGTRNRRSSRHRLGCERPRTWMGAGWSGTCVGRRLCAHHQCDSSLELRFS